jgi:hypothetical protein
MHALPADGFTNIDGMGARTRSEGEPALVGNRRLIDVAGVDLVGMEETAERMAGGGRTVVHVARSGKLWGLIAIADAVRPTSAAQACERRGTEIRAGIRCCSSGIRGRQPKRRLPRPAKAARCEMNAASRDLVVI